MLMTVLQKQNLVNRQFLILVQSQNIINKHLTQPTVVSTGSKTGHLSHLR